MLVTAGGCTVVTMGGGSLSSFRNQWRSGIWSVLFIPSPREPSQNFRCLLKLAGPRGLPGGLSVSSGPVFQGVGRASPWKQGVPSGVPGGEGPSSARVLCGPVLGLHLG